VKNVVVIGAGKFGANRRRGIVTLRNGRRGNAGQSVWLKQRR
jgi:hypothetical protein